MLLYAPSLLLLLLKVDSFIIFYNPFLLHVMLKVDVFYAAGYGYQWNNSGSWRGCIGSGAHFIFLAGDFWTFIVLTDGSWIYISQDYSLTHTHTHTHTHARAHMVTYTYVHARTHVTYIYMHARTHTHR